MGQKLFRYSKELATTPAASAAVQGEEAAHLKSRSGDKMRELIKRDYSADQVAMLRELEGQEGAARYNEAPIDVRTVVAPSASDMLKLLSQQTGLSIVALSSYPRASLALRSLISAEHAKSLGVVPVEEKSDGTVVFAISDPSNPTIVDDLRMIIGRQIEPVIADEQEIKERISAYYGMGERTIEDVIEQEKEEVGDEDVIAGNRSEYNLSDLQAIEDQGPVIKLVNILLMRAINDRASDIHIEPYPNFIRIRYRVDGVLREIPAPPKSQLIPIITRIKVMAVMDIAESRLPQDGRIKLAFEGREVDLRVASVPTVHGESIVMRVLDKSMMMMGVRNIGMLDEVLEQFIKIAHRPNGIILCTGPTGSGKTTTLYAILREIYEAGTKYITTEDPVEYELGGIQQVNINENVGLTYARCLRAILRQDPDVVLVGEIRDVETAQISVQASLTGHLVFSTLHTNSASATVTRMLDMGVEPFLITSALEGVIGQRLLRTICPNCKSPYFPDDEELEGFGVTREEIEEQGIQFMHGTGCEECNHSGYRGRMGIYELLVVNDEIRELILERATTDEIHEAAVRSGMITMRQDGWLKACMGVTTLAEVARQTPKETMLSSEEDEELPPPGAASLTTPPIPPEIGGGASGVSLPGPQDAVQNPMIAQGEAAAPVDQDKDRRTA